MIANTSENKQQSHQQKSAANSNAAAGISLPAVPVLQQKETEEPVQEFSVQQKGTAQLAGDDDTQLKPFQLKSNNTGMPDKLKAGVENLSGMDMSDVKVHYNSSQPAQLNALAYAQGNDIHIGSGQEKHLPHEAWHVVQQRQGRVQATKQMKKGVAVNDDPALEQEADVMGEKALSLGSNSGSFVVQSKKTTAGNVPVQRVLRINGVERGQVTAEEVADANVRAILNGWREAGVHEFDTFEAALAMARATRALQVRAAAFYALPFTIVTPRSQEDTNCHGYTIHQATGQFINANALLEGLGDVPGSVVVFLSNGAIMHSGRLNAGTLTHFLIGVGVVQSTIGDALCGYQRRYTLPAERQAMDTYMEEDAAAVEAKEVAETEALRMFEAIEGAEGQHGQVAGYTELLDQLRDNWNNIMNARVLTEALTTAHEAATAAYNTFIEANPIAANDATPVHSDEEEDRTDET